MVPSNAAWNACLCPCRGVDRGRLRHRAEAGAAPARSRAGTGGGEAATGGRKGARGGSQGDARPGRNRRPAGALQARAVVEGVGGVDRGTPRGGTQRPAGGDRALEARERVRAARARATGLSGREMISEVTQMKRLILAALVLAVAPATLA